MPNANYMVIGHSKTHEGIHVVGPMPTTISPSVRWIPAASLFLSLSPSPLLFPLSSLCWIWLPSSRRPSLDLTPELPAAIFAASKEARSSLTPQSARTRQRGGGWQGRAAPTRPTAGISEDGGRHGRSCGWRSARQPRWRARPPSQWFSPFLFCCIISSKSCSSFFVGS